MFDGKPSDRDEIALWIKDIAVDHRMGPDGALMQDVRITFGKKGTTNYEMHYWKSRLKKENEVLWKKFGPDLERWEKDQTLPVNGMALEAWPGINKAQIKACKDLGLRSVEDIATATDSIRQKLGIGASDLMAKAKAFVANKEGAAQAAKIAQLERLVEEQGKALDEARATIDSLGAKAGKVKRAKPEPIGAAA